MARGVLVIRVQETSLEQDKQTRERTEEYNPLRILPREHKNLELENLKFVKKKCMKSERVVEKDGVVRTSCKFVGSSVTV